MSKCDISFIDAVKVPVCLLVAEGGPGTLETVQQAILNNIPIIIVQVHTIIDASIGWSDMFLWPRDDLGGGGALSFTEVLSSVCMSVQKLSSSFSPKTHMGLIKFETWQDSLAWCIAHFKRFLELMDIHFLFDGTLFTLNTLKWQEFYVKLFSEIVTGNDLQPEMMVKYDVLYVVSNF